MAGYVSGVYEYLIKSCGGTQVGRAYLDRGGFLNDRRFMVVDRENVFLSQRDLPRMALIRPRLEQLPRLPSYEGGKMVITAPGTHDLHHQFSFKDHTSLRPEQARIHGDTCMAVYQGIEAEEWFSWFLKTSCKLMRVIRDGRVHHSSTLGVEIPMYGQDCYPILLIGQSSLDDLNSRVDGEKIPMHNFRPNIVVSGVPAYAEDAWKRIRIGRGEIRIVKPDQRCPVTTTNQDTGEQPENPWDAEPLRTLLTYRQVPGGGVVFGVNCVPENEGWINLGDTVEIFS